MRRLLRILVWATATLGLLAISASALLWWLVATTPGAGWLLERVTKRVPGTLVVSVVEGSLLGPITLAGIHYLTEPTADGSLEATADRVEIDWRPRDLLRHRLRIDRFDTTGLNVDFQPGEDPIELVDIDLPLPVLLKSLTLHDTRIRLAGQPDLTLDRLNLSASAQGDTLELLELTISSAQGGIEGSGTVTTLGDYPLDLRVAWTLPLDEDLTLFGSGRVTGDMTDLLIDQSLSSPVEMSFQGRVLTPLDAPSFEFDAQLTDLDPQAFDAALPALLLNGSIDFQGVPNDYRLAGEIDLDLNGVKPADVDGVPLDWAQGRWVFEGHGDESRFELDRLVVTAGDGELHAAGQLAWNPDLTWDLEVSAAAADPSVFLPDWPGRLDFAGSTGGRRTSDNGFRIAVTVNELTGELRGYPVSGGLQMVLDERGVELQRLNLSSGATHLQANGRLHHAWDLDWQLTSDNLAAVHRRLGGRLRAAGTIEGPRAAPHARFRIDGEGLSVDQLSLAGLAASADIDLGDDGPVTLTVTAERFSTGDLEIDSLRLELDGDREDHRLAVVVAGSDGVLRGRLKGSLTGDLDTVGSLAWSGEMEQMDLELDDLGDWRLEGVVPISAAADSLSLGWACWRSTPSGVACLEADWAATDGWRSNGSLASLPLQLFKPLFPAALEIVGDLSAKYKAATDSEGELTLDLTAESSGTVLLLDDRGLGETRSFTALLSTARIDADGVHLVADLSVAQSRMQLALALPGYRSLAVPPEEQAIEGSLTGGIEDLSAFGPFLLGVSDLQGSIDLDGRFYGSIAAPHVDGTIALHAALDLPSLGISLSKIEISATEGGAGRFRLSGEMQSGDGSRVRISGSGPVSPDSDQPTVVRIEGESFQAVDRPETQIWISPDLEISMAPDGLTITGEVVVPTAHIELTEPDHTAVPVSYDVVIRDGAEEPVARGSRVSADVRLSLGDAVKIHTDSFQALLGGSLRIQQSDGQPPTATGTLVLRQGTYRGYNQDLRIDDGRLLFSGGPIDDPAFDISAYRRASDGVIAGVRLRGTVDSPNVSLYSTPPLPEPEILSYIMRGKPSSTSGVSTEMSDAAASLGLAQSTAVLNSLGLKNVSLETDGSLDEAAIVLGTYLAPDFYVSYGVGIFEPVNTLRMRYEISYRWMLEADSSQEGSGADISFTFEK